jgi:hypothetical protein
MRALTTKHAATYWLHKCIVLVAVALLIALALTQFARYATLGIHAVTKHGEVKADAMGRGGQFERLLVW